MVAAPSIASAAEFTTRTTLTSDTTWTAADSPHVIHDGVWLTISPDATLTIEDGAVVKFGENAILSILGDIMITGTADNPVVLTSLKDDTIGGDTNADGDATVPSANDDWDLRIGDWRTDGQRTTAVIKNIQKRYSSGGMSLHNTDGFVDSVEIATSTYGIDVGYNSNVHFENLDFYNTGGDLLIAYENSSTTITDVDGTHNGLTYEYGISVFNSTAHISDVALSNFDGDGLGLYDSTVTVEDVVLTDAPFSRYVVNTFDIDGIFKNITVNNAGYYGQFWGSGGSVTIEDSSFTNGFNTGMYLFDSYQTGAGSYTLNNVTVSGFPDLGIYVADSDVNITDSLVSDSFIGIGAYSYDPLNMTITDSALLGNVYGLEQWGSFMIDARNNWWGDPTGPYHVDDNPEGSGDEIIGDVTFDPWLTAPLGEEPEDEIDPLLLEYAPILYMHEDEDYFPMNVEAFVEASALWDDRDLLSDTQLVDDGALTFADFEERAESEDTTDHYLAFSAPDESKTIDLTTARSNYDQLVESGAATSTVYVHKMEDSYTDDQGETHESIVLQYWFFYAMNNWGEQGGFNDHEGDWESVFVFLDKETEEPQYVAYSAHHNDGDPNGNVAQYDSVMREWSSADVDFDNGRIVSFVSLGSHANYPNHGSEGIHSVPGFPESQEDEVSDAGKSIETFKHLSEFDVVSSWFAMYMGKWGSDGTELFGGDNGPLGPNFIDVGGHLRFHDPIEWAGIDQTINITVSDPTNTFAFPSLGVDMVFDSTLESGTELSIDLHDELISFGENVQEINFLPQFWDLQTSLENGTFGVEVTFDYAAEQLAAWGIDEEFMQVYFYNNLENAWEPVESFIDTASESVRFHTDHFSRYAIGSPVVSELNGDIWVRTHPKAYHKDTNTRESVVSFHNKSDAQFSEDVRIVIKDLEEDIVLQNRDGYTAYGDPYIDVSIEEIALNKKFEVPLTFALPASNNTSPKANKNAKKQQTGDKNVSYSIDVVVFE